MTEVLVTEADRLAAAKYALNQIGLGDAAMRIRTGGMDDHHLVQAFAAHRIAGQAELAAEVAFLRQALEDVVNPLGKIRRDADAQGYRLSGMAYSIANDLSFAQRIAQDALSAAPFKGGIA
jgi:hypothetical protein